MEFNRLIESLKATAVADDQGNATAYLKEASKMIGFPQILLKLVVDEGIDCHVRQAGVIFLKNMLLERWMVEEVSDEEKKLPISEQDKIPLRQNIIRAIVHTSDPIRVQLCAAMQAILRYDFPDQWPALVDDLVQLLHTPNGIELHGALLIIHRLAKHYEYKGQKERAPLINAMQRILPLLFQRATTLLADNSRESCLLQEIIFKIFYCLVQYTLSLNMISGEHYGQWLHVFIAVLQRDVPAELVAQLDSPADSIFWKCKKWAMKIIARVFDRYGSKGQVEKPYAEFAAHYSNNYAMPVVNVVLKCVLEPYVHRRFVSERVLHLAITHLADGIGRAQIWRIVKPHLQEFIQAVIFPLMSYTAEDEELWEEDPEEYLRLRYDIFEDLHDPGMAASELLAAMSRRVGVLMPTLEFALSKLTTRDASPQDVDGALHIISRLSTPLNKNKRFKKDVQNLLDAHVIPRIAHPARLVRARACLVAKCYSDALFTSTAILSRLVAALVERLTNAGEEMPVKVEAATAIAALLTDQREKTLAMIRAHTRDILMEVLRLLARTQIEELPQVVETIIDNFEEDVIPVAFDVTNELVNIFNRLTGVQNPNVVANEDDGLPELSDDTTITVMGVLQTMERILCLVEDHPDIMRNVEPVVRACVINIFENFCSNYFEEALSITQTMISARISAEMWPVYNMIYDAFAEEGTLFFCDMMPVLFCYLTIDTDAFLADSARAQKLLEMCEKTLRDSECGTDSHVHAAKLVEIFVLQCVGRVDDYVPAILQLVHERCAQPHEPELYAQLLVAFIAVFHYNADLFVRSMTRLRPDNAIEWLAHEVCANEKHFDGIHNRKMLLYFISKILTLSADHLPAKIRNAPQEVVELCITQFTGLQKCIKTAAEKHLSDDESSESSDDENHLNDELKDSDDDIDGTAMEYLASLKAKNGADGNSAKNGDGDTTIASTDDNEDDDTDDYEDEEDGETELDEYETPFDAHDGGINVFALFKNSLEGLKQSNPLFYQALVGGLDEAKSVELQTLLVVCTQQANLEHSKRVARSGGYSFDTSAPVPTRFKFT